MSPPVWRTRPVIRCGTRSVVAPVVTPVGRTNAMAVPAPLPLEFVHVDFGICGQSGICVW